MKAAGKFLSCDWGSSSLRIRLFNAVTNQVEALYSGDQGSIKTHNEWMEEPGRDRIGFYSSKLRSYLNALQSSVNEDLSEMPLVISGMASSSIGMVALPYANLPFSLDGKALETMIIPGSGILPDKTLLISGVRGPADVMRGEETELIGFASFESASKDGIYIFPGTHSKHVIIEIDQAISFSTFMTGEVFALLAGQSILKSAVHEGEFEKKENKRAFIDGVKTSGGMNLLNEMFTVRASELFNTRSKEENYFFLSGLLIGHELNALNQKADSAIYLCAQGKILALYKRALHVLGHEDKTRTFSTQRSDIAVAVGQYRIFQNNY